MLNVERLLSDIRTSTVVNLPPDATACLDCQYHPENMKFTAVSGGQHCYMFKKLPSTLCMGFLKVVRSK